MMRIHKRGRFTLLITAAVIFFINSGLRQLSETGLLLLIVAILSVLVYLFLLWQFRVNLQEIITLKNSILAPCDSRLIEIKDANGKEFNNEKGVILTFKNTLFNNHQSYFPVEGKITQIKKTSIKRNQKRLQGLIETPLKTVVGFRYNAAKSRLLTTYFSENTYVYQCENMGFINWGFHMELFIPEGYDIKVNEGDTIKGNRTEIARLKMKDKNA